MPDEPDDFAIIPRVLGINLGISFFEESVDPVIVLNLMLPEDVDGTALVHGGGQLQVLPVAITPTDLQGLIPEIIECIIRSRTLVELLTTWPERRDEILENIRFRWTGELSESEDDPDGTT